MPTLASFTMDLSAHEGARLAAVLHAVGNQWDPADVEVGEAAAYRMLYSHLDADQQATYRLLLAAGVLPENPGVVS